MSYNENRNRNGMRDETSYTGWIIGGLLMLALVVGVFAFSHRSGDTNTANNTPGTSTASTPSTTGSGTANSPARNTPAAPTNAPAR